MATIIQYDKYIAAIEYDPDIDLFFGSVINLSSPLTFYGKSTEELKREFEKSVQTYLEICRERNLQPEKPFSGRFNIRMTPDQHRRYTHRAATEGKSLNTWAIEAMEQASR
jgi:predicted HicB family RNase H-like nuclease